METLTYSVYQCNGDILIAAFLQSTDAEQFVNSQMSAMVIKNSRGVVVYQNHAAVKLDMIDLSRPSTPQ